LTDELKEPPLVCMGNIHRVPQPDLCPAKKNIELGLCDENPFVNSKDEKPLKEYPKCDICFPNE